MTLSSNSSALNHKSAVSHRWRRVAQMNHLLAHSLFSFFKAQLSQSLALLDLWEVWLCECVRECVWVRTHTRIILNCNRCQTTTQWARLCESRQPGLSSQPPGDKRQRQWCVEGGRCWGEVCWGLCTWLMCYWYIWGGGGRPVRCCIVFNKGWSADWRRRRRRRRRRGRRGGRRGRRRRRWGGGWWGVWRQ